MSHDDKVLYQTGLIILVLSVPLMILSRLPYIPGLLGIFRRPCIFYSLTHFYCPGCGGTRAFKALAEGQFLASFVYNPIVLYGFILFSLFMLTNTIMLLSRSKWKIGIHYKDLYMWIGLGILAVNFVLKNLLLIIWDIRLI